MGNFFQRSIAPFQTIFRMLPEEVIRILDDSELFVGCRDAMRGVSTDEKK
jgi:hypothetical protein